LILTIQALFYSFRFVEFKMFVFSVQNELLFNCCCMKDTSGTNQVQEQGPRNSGRAGEVVKVLKAMENC